MKTCALPGSETKTQTFVIFIAGFAFVGAIVWAVGLVWGLPHPTAIRQRARIVAPFLRLRLRSRVAPGYILLPPLHASGNDRYCWLHRCLWVSSAVEVVMLAE